MTLSLDAYRQLFDVTPGKIHLNNAGVSPMIRTAKDALVDAAEVSQQGMHGIKPLIDGMSDARETFAALTGGQASDVSFFQTCAGAISQMALGLPFRKGDEIVRWDQEYPSNAYPWHRAAERVGASVVVVDSEADHSVSTEKLLSHITKKTRCVAISWVHYSTGAVTDLERVADACKANDAWLVVDAIQGLGVVPFDMEALGVDAVCGGGQKWLAGPLGHGFLVVTQALREQVEPLMYGAMSYGSPDDLVDTTKALRTDCHRFEPGNPHYLPTMATQAACNSLLELGVNAAGDAARAHSHTLAEAARSAGLEVLSSYEEGGSPIVTVRSEAGAEALVAKLDAAGVSHSQRAGGVRLSPHAHNSDGDIAQVAALLKG